MSPRPYLNALVNFLEEKGIPEELGVGLDHTIIHELFMDSDSNIKFQDQTQIIHS